MQEPISVPDFVNSFIHHTGKKESKREILKREKNKVTKNLLQRDSNPDRQNPCDETWTLYIPQPSLPTFSLVTATKKPNFEKVTCLMTSLLKNIVIEPFIYALMLIYSDVIMCYGRYVITSIEC